jgi:hypothetical protein
MRSVAIACCAALVVGCQKSENPPSQTAMATATVSLSNFAGTWRVRGFNERGDSLVGYQLIATADSTGWKIIFPNRPPIAVRLVGVAGDSVVTESGPYESVLRKGVQVRTRGVLRLQGDKLVGTTVAHYATSGPDSVLHIRAEGTRQP